MTTSPCEGQNCEAGNACPQCLNENLAYGTYDVGTERETGYADSGWDGRVEKATPGARTPNFQRVVRQCGNRPLPVREIAAQSVRLAPWYWLGHPRVALEWYANDTVQLLLYAPMPRRRRFLRWARPGHQWGLLWRS